MTATWPGLAVCLMGGAQRRAKILAGRVQRGPHNPLLKSAGEQGLLPPLFCIFHHTNTTSRLEGLSPFFARTTPHTHCGLPLPPSFLTVLSKVSPSLSPFSVNASTSCSSESAVCMHSIVIKGISNTNSLQTGARSASSSTRSQPVSRVYAMALTRTMSTPSPSPRRSSRVSTGVSQRLSLTIL